MSKSISIGSEVEVELASPKAFSASSRLGGRGEQHHHRFAIVEAQGDPTEGVISWMSPAGRALLGHEEGDVVEIEAPGKRIITTRIVRVY